MKDINYFIDVKGKRWSISLRNNIIDKLLYILNDILWQRITIYDQDEDKRYTINLEDRYKYLEKKASAMNLKLESKFCDIFYDEYHNVNSDPLKNQTLVIELELSYFKRKEKILTSYINSVLKKTKDIVFSVGFSVDIPQEEPYLDILERYEIEEVSSIMHPIFGGNDYIQIIDPQEYEPYFTKEDLLATPAYKVYEWDNKGRIFMQFYETAWDYDNPKAMGQIKRALDYLNACKKSPLDGLDLT